MTISQNKVVSVNYHLSANKPGQPEQLIEQTSTDHPFVFLFGAGQLLPDFEKNLVNKKAGDRFDFKIDAASGYGVSEADMIVKINKEAFNVDGKFDDERVKIGEDLAMNDADGNQLMGTVTEVGDNHVTMDFNHPLADHQLHFSGEVLDVREATDEELAHGHVHGPHGHHH